MEILCIFIGGALGALLRYLTYTQIDHSFVATFLANMLGCFIIGFSAYLFGRNPSHLNKCIKGLLTVGLAGGLTTFSTFVFDLYQFLLSSNLVGLLVYLLLSVLLGVCLVSLGINLAYSFMVKIIKSRKGRNING